MEDKEEITHRHAHTIISIVSVADVPQYHQQDAKSFCQVDILNARLICSWWRLCIIILFRGVNCIVILNNLLLLLYWDRFIFR